MSKISEKLKYLKETKGLIRKAIEEQGGIIEDTTPFRKYADIIKNIPGNMGELESWRRVELPVEFSDPVYFGPDSDHVFVTEYSYHSAGKPSSGLWLYCYSTNTWTQLYNQYGGYRCMTVADDGSYVFYPYAYGTEIVFDLISYNLVTGEFKVLGEQLKYKYTNDTKVTDHGLLFTCDKYEEVMWNKHINQITVRQQTTQTWGSITFGDYMLFDLGLDTRKLANVFTGEVKQIQGNYLTKNSSYIQCVTLTPTTGLLSYAYSTTTQGNVGLFLIDAMKGQITQIYDVGYNWNHVEEFDNCFLVNSTASLGVLKISKDTYQCQAITTSGSAWTKDASLEKLFETVVGINGKTAVITNVSSSQVVSLYDVEKDMWNVLYNYTGTSSITRRILRSDKMVLALGGQYNSGVGYAIHKQSTVDNPIFVRSTVSVSPNNLYRTKWGYALSSSETASTSRVVAFVVEGDNIRQEIFSSQYYIRECFESYNYGYFYNNNNDDGNGNLVQIDPNDFSKCKTVIFGNGETYNLSGVYQGSDSTIHIFGYSTLGVYNEKTGEMKYYGDMGYHLDDYGWSKDLPSWPYNLFSVTQAGPEHDCNWILRDTVLFDEKQLTPQNAIKLDKLWKQYTYNQYYIVDIYSRRMLKLVPEDYDFTNYWLYNGISTLEEGWYEFKATISSKYLIICKDGEE